MDDDNNNSMVLQLDVDDLLDDDSQIVRRDDDLEEGEILDEIIAEYGGVGGTGPKLHSKVETILSNYLTSNQVAEAQ
jgi:hypothetical protein